MRKPPILLLKEIYYPLLAAACLPANMMTVFILLRRNCGLSKCISTYMVAMATADLLVIINSIIVYRILSYHFPFSFLSHTPVCKLTVYMITVSLDLTVWFTVSFTFDRFVVICCQRFKAKYCTKRTATTVLTVISVLILLKNIPVLFAYEPEQIINNIQWGCRSSANFLVLVGIPHVRMQGLLVEEGYDSCESLGTLELSTPFNYEVPLNGTGLGESERHYKCGYWRPLKEGIPS
ncbi:probable G-protein coupled receptor 139 [Stegostoma tigrinum]|uniref:probable G-protein coupled receptor 139 n=1 Tax=Stegostoma tigrinum TaxID=3053191 RepID=UPI0028704EAA|nr:probable G-protein coupled receptor 139 [Stegostoma tigrinum]